MRRVYHRLHYRTTGIIDLLLGGRGANSVWDVQSAAKKSSTSSNSRALNFPTLNTYKSGFADF
jgi:hypothetical protein